MRKRVLRVLGSLFVVGCSFGILGCDGEINTQDIRDMVRADVEALVVGIGTAILEASVEAALD